MQDRVSRINPRLNTLAALLVVLVTLFGAFYASTLNELLQLILDTTMPFLEWYYVAVVAFLFFLIAWLGLGRYRHVRLGRDDAIPDFRLHSWLSMLFAAGTGVGLIFWSIAEPISHLAGNPFSGNGDEATTAMRLTFFHWGLNGWAIFSTVALVLAYFGYRHAHPLTLSAALTPILGRRSKGLLGESVDLFAVLATVFGVATTLGLGARQMSSGLDAVLGIEVSTTQQLIIIALVTVAGTLSVAAGLRRGVRVLSVFNLWLTLILFAFFLLFGPSQYQMSLFVQSTGDYLQNLIGMSFWTNANGDQQWQEQWTVFFWGWWIAWSPFVGMFIARISRGRTIGEFVFGVMLVPSLFSFLWIALFGGTALHLELHGDGGIIEAVQNSVPSALFTTIDAMQAPDLVATTAGLLALVLIATYFITSADSGTLVITTLLCDGYTQPPRWLRISWGLGVGTLTAVLLVAGGIKTLQSAVITAALPFSLILLLMVVGLLRALEEEPQSPRKGMARKASKDPLTETRPPP